MLKIHSERLEVEIAQPGELYRGTRFDWTGLIVQVILDGKHTFCASESELAGHGGGRRGFCNEFGILDPIGFDEAMPGERFLKIGVGLLTRPDRQPYSHGCDYKLVPCKMEYHATSRSVQFTVLPQDCRGYSVRLEKTVSVSDNRLEINYMLANSGEKLLKTDEYNHNFLCIDGHQIGPEYNFETAFPLTEEKVPPPLRWKNNAIDFANSPDKPFYYPVPQMPGGMRPRWELVHIPSRTGVRETSVFPLARFALWGAENVISPETFFRIELKPGKTISWMRSYEFKSAKTDAKL